MKKIFIYYSLTGNGDYVANYLKEHGYDIRKVFSKHKYFNSKFFKIMQGGYRASFNKKDKLDNFNSDISIYDEIVIGSPVWADSLSSPINTVLSKLDFNNKKVKFILYSGSGVGEKACSKIKELYSKDIIVLKEPKNNKEELNKLKEFL